MNHEIVKNRIKKGDPVAFIYEIANTINMHTREYSNYQWEVSFVRPSIKPPLLRNLTELYALTPDQLHMLQSAKHEAAESESEDLSEAGSPPDLSRSS